MRHRKKINSLGRKAAHRKETMSSMATALILNKRINTTVAKAKALRTYVEPLITKSRTDNTHSRRTVFSYLKDKHAVSELFREVAQKVADRPGGYTRILKTGFRKGDAAEMCFIELVDYNTAMLTSEEETQQKRTRRGRRRGKKAGPAEGQPEVATAAPAEESAEKEETTTPESQDTPAEEQPQADVKEETPQADKISPEDKKAPEAEEVAEKEDAGEEAKEEEVKEEEVKEEAPEPEKKEEKPTDEDKSDEEEEETKDK